MNNPPLKVAVSILLLASFVALMLLLLLPQWWPRLIAVHFLCLGVAIYPALRPNCGWFGPVVKSFRPDGKEVWLTIDDGPHPVNTPRMLELLGRFGARATFFVVGDRVRTQPHLTRAILNQGHTLGNHSATHPKAFFWCFPKRAAMREIERGAATIREATGFNTAWFRAPVGMANLFVHEIVHQRQLKLIGWSSRGLDGVDGDAHRIAKRVIRDIYPGAIVLLHDGCGSQEGSPAAVHALEGILEHLHQEGYRCVIPAEQQLCC